MPHGYAMWYGRDMGWERREDGGCRGMGLQQRAQGKKEGKGSEAKEDAIVAAMAAHQMPTTAPGMPHPNAVMATQYAHSQPQVHSIFFRFTKWLQNEQILGVKKQNKSICIIHVCCCVFNIR
jgi:hypothetical protein